MRNLKWFVAALAVSLVLVAAGDENRRRNFEPPLFASVGSVRANGIAVHSPELVSQLTGAEAPVSTEEPWNIYGTDLGIPIEHDDKLYVVFGDTWGRDESEGDDWRSNTMAIIESDPVHGYVISDVIKGENGEAQELLSSLKEPETEYTVMPTSGISIDGRMYLHYMSINDWDQQWWDYKYPVVNGSGLAYSDDDGQTWTKDEGAWWPGDTTFTQTAMVKEDGYVYIFGTPAGRFGSARLLRVSEDDLLDPAEYEYWAGHDWNPDPALATDVVPAPVGELSVRWSEDHERWLMMYKNEVNHTIVLRTAEELQGPWDAERVVVTAADYPSLYAPYILSVDDSEVYFTMSKFNSYQVYVMRFTL